MAFFSPKWRLSGELSGEPPCAYLDEEERLCWYQRASFDNVSAVLAHWNDDLRETILELPPPDPPVEPDDAEAAFLRDWHPILRTWAESGRDFIRLAGSQLVFEVPIPEDRLPQSLQDLEEELEGGLYARQDLLSCSLSKDRITLAYGRPEGEAFSFRGAGVRLAQVKITIKEEQGTTTFLHEYGDGE